MIQALTDWVPRTAATATASPMIPEVAISLTNSDSTPARR
jgi:hypothetical protein